MEQRKPNAPIDWRKKLPQMARRLEESLFRGSASFDEYKDKSTLKKRMQKLAFDMGIRSRENSIGHMNNEANGSVRKGVATRQSTRSSTTTGAPKGIAASSSSSLSFSNSVRSALAATRAPGAASRRRLDSVSPVEYILSCSEDTEPLVISVFHYLTDSDLYNASLVCKAYLKTAFDQALWDYDGLNDGLHPAVDEIDGSILLSM